MVLLPLRGCFELREALCEAFLHPDGAYEKSESGYELAVIAIGYLRLSTPRPDFGSEPSLISYYDSSAATGSTLISSVYCRYWRLVGSSMSPSPLFSSTLPLILASGSALGEAGASPPDASGAGASAAGVAARSGSSSILLVF